jgi:hypothetical protein
LVRYKVSKQGYGFSANDRLLGSIEVSNALNDIEEFSRIFDATEFNQFMFANSDYSKMFIAAKSEVAGENYDGVRIITKSLSNSCPFKAKWVKNEDKMIISSGEYTDSDDIMY